jgi:hypothetical protein
MDETCIGRRGKRIAIIVDPESGDPVSVWDGKAGTARKPLREIPGRRGKRIGAVAADTSPAFMKPVSGNLPDAAVIFDHFHVAWLTSGRLDGMRRAFSAQGPREVKDALRGIRRLPLRNGSSLSGGRDEGARLDGLLAMNTPLTAACILKESLKLVWEGRLSRKGKPSLRDGACGPGLGPEYAYGSGRRIREAVRGHIELVQVPDRHRAA